MIKFSLKLSYSCLIFLHLTGDIRLAAEEVGVAGDVYILDASVATAKHFGKITPGYIKKFLVCVQVSLLNLQFLFVFVSNINV